MGSSSAETCAEPERSGFRWWRFKKECNRGWRRLGVALLFKMIGTVPIERRIRVSERWQSRLFYIVVLCGRNQNECTHNAQLCKHSLGKHYCHGHQKQRVLPFYFSTETLKTVAVAIGGCSAVRWRGSKARTEDFYAITNWACLAWHLPIFFQMKSSNEKIRC